jgi:mono/diheme cytochrome c family protein
MERKIIAIVAMIAAMALLFLGYGFREPARQVVAQEAQLDTSIGRGIDNFTALCFPCHGEKGQGAVVPDFTPLRLAPPLNRPDLRPTEADLRTKEYDFIFKTIQRGRPGTPMPAWGRSTAPLLDEHINELTLMILNGDRKSCTKASWRRRGAHRGRRQRHVAQGVAAPPKQPDVETLAFYQALNRRSNRA